MFINFQFNLSLSLTHRAIVHLFVTIAATSAAVVVVFLLYVLCCGHLFAFVSSIAIYSRALFVCEFMCTFVCDSQTERA